jgi:hypothetical protein
MSEQQFPSILIEWPESYTVRGGGVRKSLEDIQAESEMAFNMAMGAIRLMAVRMAKTVREIERDAMPDEVAIEFALKLDIEAGAVVPIVAKTSTGGQFTVKFMWKIVLPEEARVLVSSVA